MMLRYTIFLHANRDTSAKFGQVGAFAYRLVRPDGAQEDHTMNEREPIRTGEGISPFYPPVMEVIARLPEGSHLHVISREEPLCDGPGYLGVFNVAPAGRRASGYTRKGGNGQLANVDQLQALDAALLAKGITTSGSIAKAGEERGVLASLKAKAQWALAAANRIIDGVEDY